MLGHFRYELLQCGNEKLFPPGYSCIGFQARRRITISKPGKTCEVIRVLQRVAFLAGCEPTPTAGADARILFTGMGSCRGERLGATLDGGFPTRLRGGGNPFSCCFGGSKSVGETCEFEVVVHYQGKDDCEYDPAILGSAPCLGEWDPHHAQLLTHGPGDLRYSATIRFPKCDGQYEFKYVLVPRNSDKELQWEKGHNRQVRVTSRGQVELGNDSAMPHHLRHTLNIAPPCVDIVFVAHWAPERPSQTLAIVGSHERAARARARGHEDARTCPYSYPVAEHRHRRHPPRPHSSLMASRPLFQELGAWDPKKAIPLIPGTVDKQNRLQWRVAVALPFPLLVEFKFLRVECSASGE
eukprot:3865426-Rhodomonas_salina.1